MDYLFCEHIQEHLGLDFYCCGSCHEDADLGYSQLLEDYSDSRGMEKGFMLNYCCQAPKLSDEEFKKLVNKWQVKEAKQ